MPQSEEMKACPFCGAEPMIEHVAIEDCEWRCCCPNWNECEAQPETFGRTRKQAIAAWNTRPTPALKLREVLEEQTALVDRLCTAIDQAAEDIGHENIDDLLAMIGPANERAIEALGGRAALFASPVSEGEMVERVARAIPNAALACGETGSRREWEGLTSDEREGFIRLARAAIAAMQSGKQGG